MPKSQQLQIRVSAEEKAGIRYRAALAGMDVSKWVLHQVLPPVEGKFQALCSELGSRPTDRAYTLAELNDFLAGMTRNEFLQAVRYPPNVRLQPFEANYLAAMIELTAADRGSQAPKWTKDVQPLEAPWFASKLTSLRLYLLTRSPPVFRRRNLFVDSSVGSRL